MRLDLQLPNSLRKLLRSGFMNARWAMHSIVIREATEKIANGTVRTLWCPETASSEIIPAGEDQPVGPCAESVFLCQFGWHTPASTISAGSNVGSNTPTSTEPSGSGGGHGLADLPHFRHRAMLIQPIRRLWLAVSRVSSTLYQSLHIVTPVEERYCGQWDRRVDIDCDNAGARLLSTT